MKKHSKPLILSLFLAILISFSFSYYNSGTLINSISNSIRNGNASAIADHFASNIELLLPDNEGTYSKTQAEAILRNFFNSNQPQSFSVNHQGSSRDGSQYAIGTYIAKNGLKYRTYFLIKKVSNKYMLHQLQFEKQ